MGKGARFQLRTICPATGVHILTHAFVDRPESSFIWNIIACDIARFTHAMNVCCTINQRAITAFCIGTIVAVNTALGIVTRRTLSSSAEKSLWIRLEHLGVG